MKVWPGHHYPRGATWDGSGVNFALFAEHASGVELCLFDSRDAARESQRIPLPDRTNHVWHGYFRDLRPGQVYGYRVHGAYAPERGQRSNPLKVLLDPYAKAIARPLAWHDTLFGYTIGHPDADLSFDERDSVEYAPRAAVLDPAFDWKDDRPPRTPWHRTLIYELHVRGFTKQHPGVPEALRGTYAGLASPASIAHLKNLGVTAVELMPVHHFVDDRHLVERGQRNYWGYNTLAYFAPEPRYSSSRRPQGTVVEFKEMVRELHAAGLEVILDVVYNHTAEGNQFGPTICQRGIDNASYYRLAPQDPRHYEDFTGCGNTLNMRHPRVLQLVMDSLRYWVLEMHVDGFRFDLASALAREERAVDRLSGFFDIIQQDPVLMEVKLIAEPWDVGEGGYQLGNFPVGWAEWNGRYRDSIRTFWGGAPATAAEFATRFCGSSDLYEGGGRRPFASINFVTSHDGFTLQDLVSYNEKHNEANGERNLDGTSHNFSWNCGVEGPTDDPTVLSLRARQQRNIIASLLLSQGVPMLLAGDEMGRTQRGNNNAYCQDSDIGWLDWALDERRRSLLEFAQRVVRLWRSQPVLQRRRFLRGRPIPGSALRDVQWYQPSGAEMGERDWQTSFVRSFGALLAGDAIEETDSQGRKIAGDTLLVLFNAHDEPLSFTLPALGGWECLLDTAEPGAKPQALRPGAGCDLQGRSMVVLRLAR